VFRGVQAATLHYSAYSVPLAASKQTNPSLVVMANGVKNYGPMYTDAAPANALRMNVGGTKYWVGAYCVAGTYSATGASACQNCGPGYYCGGNRARTVCTWGACGCNSATNATDSMAPAACGGMLNRLLTLDEVNAYIPPTDISQWRMISCCSTQAPGGVMGSWSSSIVNDINAACANGSIGPGTYLFVQRYSYNQYVPAGSIDPLSGQPGQSNSYIAVFDHTVGYHSVHGGGIFNNLVDTAHAAFQTYTLAIPIANGWNVTTNRTNVANIASVVGLTQLCVFELK